MLIRYVTHSLVEPVHRATKAAGWHHAAKRLPERVAAWRAKAGVPTPRMIASKQPKR